MKQICPMSLGQKALLYNYFFGKKNISERSYTSTFGIRFYKAFDSWNLNLKHGELFHCTNSRVPTLVGKSTWGRNFSSNLVGKRSDFGEKVGIFINIWRVSEDVCNDKSLGMVNITTHEPGAFNEIFSQEKVPKLIIDYYQSSLFFILILIVLKFFFKISVWFSGKWEFSILLDKGGVGI